MGFLEGSSVHVLYIGHTVPKGYSYLIHSILNINFFIDKFC
jgi:hypothetical protein